MEKNNEEKGVLTNKQEVFEVRSKSSDRLTVKEAKLLFSKLSSPDCPYKTLNIRTVISSDISELLYRALLKNKSITSIFGEHSFGSESSYLKAIKKNPNLPLKSLSISCPSPSKKLAPIFKRQLQLTSLALHFFGGSSEELDSTLDVISTSINTLEHLSIKFGADIEIGPVSVEKVLRSNQGLRTVSIDIKTFTYSLRIARKMNTIGRILAELPSLTTLKFLVDSIENGEEDFMEGLKGSKTIKELHLNQYWLDLESGPLIEYLLSLPALKILRLKGYEGLHRYKFNVNENNLVDASKLFDSESQLVEIECNFIPFMKEKLFAALKTNTNLKRIYIQPFESVRVIARLYEELKDRLEIDICHMSPKHLPYELLLEYHQRSERRKYSMSITNNLQVISAARDRGLFAILPQEVLEMIWFKALNFVMTVDIKQAAAVFEQLGARYRK